MKVQTYSIVMYAGSYCCTPPLEEEITQDWTSDENQSEKQVDEILQENVLVDPSNIKLNETIITEVHMSKSQRGIKTSKRLSGECQPTPSPRLRRNKKGNGDIDFEEKFKACNANQNKDGNVTDTSITSFDNLITDLLVTNTKFEDKSCILNSKENTKNKRMKNDDKGRNPNNTTNTADENKVHIYILTINKVNNHHLFIGGRNQI